MKWALLLGSSLVAACIAASGFMLLTGLVVTRSLSPPIASYERELFFDYTQPQAVAAATFAPMPSSPLKVCMLASDRLHGDLLLRIRADYYPAVLARIL
jgi:hypothetical protein